MSTHVPIPAVVTPRLREGAQSAIRSLGCELEDAADTPPAFGELYDQLRSIWGLLDVIGWSDENDGGEIKIDLRKHSAALVAALDSILPMLAEWTGEMADDDEEKPLRQYEYLRMRQFHVIVRRGTATAEGGR
jgi:hypothetical protein